MKTRSLRDDDNTNSSRSCIGTVFENLYDSVRNNVTRTVYTVAAGALLSACASGDYFSRSEEVYHQKISHSARAARFFGRFGEEDRKSGFEQWLEQHPGWEFLIDRAAEIGLYLIIDNVTDKPKRSGSVDSNFGPEGPPDRRDGGL